jgi:hypothetical protein
LLLQTANCVPTSKATFLTEPALSATYTAPGLNGSSEIANNLLWSLIGLPSSFLDLAALRLLSSIEALPVGSWLVGWIKKKYNTVEMAPT